MLPLAEGAVTTITCTVPVTLGMEARKLVKADLVARVLCAEDAAALAAVVTALEESKGLLARRGGADQRGSIGLKKRVSIIGLDFRYN